jgi:TPP-dependent pyruvate/acetoin dehydrogenase alpha subunit
MMGLSPYLPPDEQREMLRQMLMIRRFEERASADYLAGKIYGVQLPFRQSEHSRPRCTSRVSSCFVD